MDFGKGVVQDILTTTVRMFKPYVWNAIKDEITKLMKSVIQDLLKKRKHEIHNELF